MHWAVLEMQKGLDRGGQGKGLAHQILGPNESLNAAEEGEPNPSWRQTNGRQGGASPALHSESATRVGFSGGAFAVARVYIYLNLHAHHFPIRL